MKSWSVFSALLAAAFSAIMGMSAAFAAPSYCNSGPGDSDSTTNTDSPALSTSNMTYNGANATDCYGRASGNDDAAAMNALKWGSGWQFAARDNKDGADTSNVVAGIQWTLTTDSGKSGNWLLAGTDTNGVAGANLGDVFDFIGILKGGNGYAAYYFQNVVFDGSDGGRWRIVFENNGNQVPNLSHMSIYAREAGGPPGKVSAPAEMALLGAGFIAFGLTSMAHSRRRKTS